MDNLLMITILVFLSAFFTIMGIYMFIYSGMEKRVLLEKIQHDGSPAASGGAGCGESGPASVFAPLVRLTMRLGNLIRPKDENEISRNRLLFLRAGYRHRNMPIVFLGLKLLL